MQNCSTCGNRIVAGSLFCDSCGAATHQPKIARKLRQSSFTVIKDAKEGILSPGEKIKGRRTYIIQEAVAKSGFGATFRAIRADDEKQVLIKQMLDQPSYDQFRGQLLKSFKREASFLRKVKHPAFPTGYEYFEKNKSFYLVMDFINGKELAKALADYRKERGKIEDGLLVYLGIEIAEALEIIHLQGYIYRDLKPQNVMLDGISSKVKLIDFGTLYHPSDSNPLLFESEGYTPPDLLDKSKKPTAAGDIYGLGALLYEAAVGETPEFGKATGLDKSKRDKRLCEIIKKCLETDPEKRYQRARHLKDDLAKLTRKGFWPFKNKNHIEKVELSVLPKTLFPSTSTFCIFCDYADPDSQVGYCPKCRVPLRVGKLTIKLDQKDGKKDFYLFSDETVIGSSSQCHFPLPKGLKGGEKVSSRHFRIFRKDKSLWLESIEKDKSNTHVNRRRVLGPIELIDGDTIKVSELNFLFNIREAC